MLRTPYMYIKAHMPSNRHSIRAASSQLDDYKVLLDECCNEWNCQVLPIDNTIMEHLESTKLTKRIDHVQQPALKVTKISENTQ